jgi:hypothetical protein
MRPPVPAVSCFLRQRLGFVLLLIIMRFASLADSYPTIKERFDDISRSDQHTLILKPVKTDHPPLPVSPAQATPSL